MEDDDDVAEQKKKISIKRVEPGRADNSRSLSHITYIDPVGCGSCIHMLTGQWRHKADTL